MSETKGKGISARASAGVPSARANLRPPTIKASASAGVPTASANLSPAKRNPPNPPWINRFLKKTAVLAVKEAIWEVLSYLFNVARRGYSGI